MTELELKEMKCEQRKEFFHAYYPGIVKSWHDGDQGFEFLQAYHGILAHRKPGEYRIVGGKR